MKQILLAAAIGTALIPAAALAADKEDCNHQINKLRVNLESLHTQLRNTAPTIRRAIEEPSSSTNAVLEAMSNVSHEMGFIEASCADEKPMASISSGGNTYTPASPCDRRILRLKQVQRTLKDVLDLTHKDTPTTGSIPNPLYEALFKEKIALQADLRSVKSSCKS